MRDIGRAIRELRGQHRGPHQPEQIIPEGAPVRSLGPEVHLYPDAFVVQGRRFRRRQFPPDDNALQPLLRRRPRAKFGDSQISRLPPPSQLLQDVPAEREVFSYLTPAMARTLGRIASIDSSPGRHRFVLLVGPTGCGKTTLAKTYCYLANQPCSEISFSGDTTLTDFYTSVEVVRESGGSQSTVTAPGPAVDAMLRGKKLLLNEINMLSADILTVFFQAMDTRRLMVSGTERGNVEIDVHPQFGIIGTGNPNYVGTIDLGRAMERRFGRGLGYIELDFIPPDEEALAVQHELENDALFRENGVTFDTVTIRRLVDAVAELRKHPQIGEVVRSRLSTRALIHWLSLSSITGLELLKVAEQALLATAPTEARIQALDILGPQIASLQIDSPAVARLRAHRIRWPALRSGETVPVSAVPAYHRRSQPRGEVVVHHLGHSLTLADGTRVLLAEPLHRHDGALVALGIRVRAYDAAGRQIRDPQRLASIRGILQDTYGINVPRPIGHHPRPDDLLAALTPSSLRYLELAEAALMLGRPVFLTGPTGCGKSSLARTLARLRGSRVVEFSFTGETAKADLSASRRLIGGVTRWTIQAFLEALSRDVTVIVNEYNVAYPDVHSLINSLFDKGTKLSLPDGSVHQMHPQARLIATGYLTGPGVKPLNEGVENRFGAVISMDYPPVEDEVALLRFSASSVGTRSLVNCVAFVDYCRRLAAGQVDPATLESLSQPAQEALRQAARRAALSTAELVALVRDGEAEDLAVKLRRAALEGAPDAIARVLEPVLAQFEV